MNSKDIPSLVTIDHEVISIFIVETSIIGSNLGTSNLSQGL